MITLPVNTMNATVALTIGAPVANPDSWVIAAVNRPGFAFYRPTADEAVIIRKHAAVVLSECIEDLNEFDLCEVVERQARHRSIDADDLHALIVSALPADHPELRV